MCCRRRRLRWQLAQAPRAATLAAADDASDDATLSALTLSGMALTFDPAATAYAVDVDASVSIGGVAGTTRTVSLAEGAGAQNEMISATTNPSCTSYSLLSSSSQDDRRQSGPTA